ncbi:MAG: sulfatase [Deltaproteobacteria bacterium]|nr:sulfatase [Deltaproteobacteria bacterium]
MRLVALALALIVCGIGIFVLLRQGSDEKPNILIVMVDTLRADHLGYSGYERDTSPNIDRFAAENRIYRNAFSSSSWTPPSVASLFTSVFPTVHGHMPRPGGSKFGRNFTKLPESFVTLAEALQAAGYATAGITANPLVSEKYGMQQGFEQYYSPGREKGDRITKRAIKYLSDLRPKDKPFFLYLHYLDPHDPYKPPKPYDKMFSGPIKRWPYGEAELQIISQYDGEIRFVDKEIGKLFDWLKEQGLYEEMIIVFVSDHGEQFRERGFLGHGDRLHSEEIHIPLIIKAPGFEGEELEPVSLVDVYPTLVDLLKLEPSPDFQGLSLMDQERLKARGGVTTEIFRHYNLKAFTTAKGQRLILEYDPDKGLRLDSLLGWSKADLFELRSDPLELKPLLTDAIKENPVFDAAQKTYLSILKLTERHSVSEVPENEEMIRELKTLGYL